MQTCRLFVTFSVSLLFAGSLFGECSWTTISGTSRMYTSDCTKVGVGTTTDPKNMFHLQGVGAALRVDETYYPETTIYGANFIQSNTDSEGKSTVTARGHRLEFGYPGFHFYHSLDTTAGTTRTWYDLFHIDWTGTAIFYSQGGHNSLEQRQTAWGGRGRLQTFANTVSLGVNTAGTGPMYLDDTNYPGWLFFLSASDDTATLWRVPNGSNPHSDSQEMLRVDSSGNLRVKGSVTANGLDLAEWVPATTDMPPGTVVILNPEKTNEVMLSTHAYDTAVAGVVAERPGLILGEAAPTKEMIATTGRVKVRVDATKDPIKIGDLLVTSGKPGVAMISHPIEVSGIAIHRPGTLIGKALEPLAGGEGEILVLLSLQ